MRREKLMVFTVIVLLFLIPFTIASTDFTIKTIKDHRISLIVRGEGKLVTVDSFHKDTGEGSGEAELSFSTTSVHDYLDIIVSLKKDGNKIIDKSFSSLASGGNYIINMVPGEDNDIVLKSDLAAPEEVVEEEAETEETEEVVESETEETSDEIVEEETTEEVVETDEVEGSVVGTGFSIKELIPSKSLSYIFWIIGIVAVLFVVVVMARKRVGKRKGNFNFSSPSSGSDRRIDNAERRLKEAQEEIRKLKDKEDNQRKLREVEDRYKRDQEEIKRLKADLD